MNGIIKLKATSPCLKFINATPQEQMAKIRKKVDEVDEAWATLGKGTTEEALIKLFELLIDVKACVNTAIAQVHHAVKLENARNYAEFRKQQGEDKVVFAEYLDSFTLEDEAKCIVAEKNARRGYYWEDEK